MKKRELAFRPMSEGLGFHPFSDGLPYAPPVQKTKSASHPGSGISQAAARASTMKMGTGAVSAGRPTMAAPAPSQTTVSQSPTFPPRPRISVPVAHKQIQREVPVQTSQPPRALMVETTFGMVYVLKRVFAYSLDTILNLSLCAGALSAALWRQDMNPSLLMNPGIILVAALFVGIFHWALVTAQEIAFGTTVGKRIFGLTLNGTASAIFLRSFFFLPSIGFCGAGLIWALFDSKKRCWHDIVVGVQPAETASL